MSNRKTERRNLPTKHVPLCSIFVQIDSNIHIFELDLKNLPNSGDGELFDEELYHLNEPFHCPEGLQTGLIVYLFKLLN